MKLSLTAAVAGALLLAACSGGATLNQAPPSGAAVNASNSGVPFAANSRLAAAPILAAAAGAGDTGPDQVSPDETKAAAYCKQTGGTVYMRRAEYNTNGPNPLVLAGRKPFCQYTATDGSRIHILLSTLYAVKPSLAALAYILKPPTGQCNGNPASCYCTLLGGSDQFGGASGAGGSWVNNKSEDVDLEACIFPDMSSIDSWGLAYNANGIIRGIDLTKVMRYKYPSNLKAR
jgi:hypothetical protein